nr:MAG TPA: hypothetical protein [Caudoviricetes sp.]
MLPVIFTKMLIALDCSAIILYSKIKRGHFL